MSEVQAEKGSVLAALRAQRAAISRKKTEDFPIPGYEGLLFKVRPMQWEESVRINEAADRFPDGDRELLLAAHAFTIVTEHLVIEENGERRPLTYGDLGIDGGQQVATFNSTVAKALTDEDTDSAMDAIRAIFGNDVALYGMWELYDQWCTAAMFKVEQEGAEGNSPAAS